MGSIGYKFNKGDDKRFEDGFVSKVVSSDLAMFELGRKHIAFKIVMEK